jgi:hypothetical protein
VFWLNGLAGTGKTTVAQSVASLMVDKKWLGASFFCSRASDNLSNVNLIFSTIAYQLSCYDHLEGLLDTLEKRENIGHASPGQQIDELIIQPLRKMSNLLHPIIIVLDALDECKDGESTSAILALLSEHISRLPFLKFFIASRPESHLRAAFRQEPLKLSTQIFLLHDIERHLVQSDIRVFLNFRLKNIAAARSDISLSSPWPPEISVETLLQQCGAHFIYAFTACVFIESKFHDPRRRLEILITSAQRSTVNVGIDKLYSDIFKLAFEDLDDSEVFFHLRRILSAVVLLFDPLSLQDMASLLETQPSDIRRSLRHLHSVVVVPENNEGSVGTFHTSFHDFLTQPDRCRDPRFHISPPLYHAQLTLRCLHYMLKNLSSFEPEGAEAVSEHGNKCLRYSSRHWANHLIEVSHEDEAVGSILSVLRTFLFSKQHVRAWIEVVRDLSGAPGGASSSINKTAR